MSFLEYEQAQVVVDVEGSPNAPIALVGEALGREEVLARENFCGKAGNLLNTLLGTAGISRSTHCSVRNVIKERPLNNNAELFIKFKKKEVITTAAYDAYEAELLDELSKTNANVIVPMGNIPLYAILKLFPPKIRSRRGSMYGVTIGDDLRIRKVIPTIHPSAALRQYMFRLSIMKDFKRIKEESLTPNVNTPIRRLHIFPNYSDVMSYLATIVHMKQFDKHVGFDIEVSSYSRQMTHISVSNRWNYSMSICFFRKGESFYSLFEEYEILKTIRVLLEDKTIPKLAQNGSFDFGFMLRNYGMTVNNMDDTMVAQGIIHPDMPKDLGFIVSTRSDEPYYKDDGGKLHGGLGVSDQVFSEYSAKDSAVLHDCWPSLVSDLSRLDNIDTYELTKQTIEPYVFMSQHGILVDVEGRDRVAAIKEKEKEELCEQLNEIVGFDINPDSPKQVMEYFYNTKGIKPYLKNKKPTCDETALTRLSIRGYDEADILLEIRGLTAAIPKYWRAELVDNRLKCSYNPIGAADTGRSSSSKTIFDEGMNQQNQPHEVRQFYTPDPGHIIGEIDYSQAESRCVAHFSPEPLMIKAFEDGIDIHAQTASSIFNKPVHEISKEKGSTKIGRGKYSERDIGKHSDHSFNYFLSAQGFSLRFGIDLANSHTIRQGYLNLYPGIERYWKYVQNELSQNRKLVNPLGRTRLFLNRMDDDLYREGYSYLPQSTVATAISQWGLVPFYYDDEFKDVTLLNQVHDSIGFQIPLSIGWEKIAKLLHLMKFSLEQTITWRGYEFVIPAECKLGFNMMEMDAGDNPNGLQDVDMGNGIDGLTRELRSKFNNENY